MLQAGVSQHPAPLGLRLTPQPPGSEVVVAAGSMGAVGLAKELSPSLPGKAGRWGLFSTLFPFFWHERWFGARFCMMALPIQNVLQEQLLIISIEKRQLIMYCPQSVFYSLCGATGMFSNVAYSPNKYFYLAGTLAACLNVV